MPPKDDFNPVTGRPEPLDHTIRRILAPNPSPMTYRGTNTYLVGVRALGVVIGHPLVDPGFSL